MKPGRRAYCKNADEAQYRAEIQARSDARIAALEARRAERLEAERIRHEANVKNINTRTDRRVEAERAETAEWLENRRSWVNKQIHQGWVN